jgi:hypothetical protein
MEISSERFVINALADDAFVMVNKRLLRHLKGDGSAAVFLGELISAYKYHLNNQSLDVDGTFSCPIKRFEISIGLSEYKQHRILEKFMMDGICKVMLKGFPASKYVLLDFDVLARILSTDDLRFKKIEQQSFYNEINNSFNMSLGNTSSPDGKELADLRERCLDNMGPPLRGAVQLISERYLANKMLVNWDGETIGKMKTWVSRRTMGKPFDFTIVTRTLDAMKIPEEKTFSDFINAFILNARTTQDVHYNSQVHDYTTLLSSNKE